ncbi:hypothetical protein [Bacillus norwichensis]|uniref:Uncharacterized protein n=1 Tax=Bacillus norwichensis TaxID=2762217 RepID=A0ABR8VID9_9BACI|nr:hypothetical protein [Bacillus norwichensis]MBD8004546.1 hypothetical protein [Bacillus norwichensis]
MSKQFSVAQLKDEIAIYDEFVEIPVTVQGKEYTVKMFPYFKPEKVRDLVKELQEFFQECQKVKFTVPKIEEEDLIGYFIIKHFTNMKFTKSKKVKTIYNEFKIALNSSLFKILMDSYPKESITSVYERIYSVLEASALLEDKIKETQKVIKDMSLENKELLEQLNNKGSKDR